MAQKSGDAVSILAGGLNRDTQETLRNAGRFFTEGRKHVVFLWKLWEIQTPRGGYEAVLDRTVDSRSPDLPRIKELGNVGVNPIEGTDENIHTKSAAACEWLTENDFSTEPVFDGILKEPDTKDPYTDRTIGWVQIFGGKDETISQPDNNDITIFRQILIASINENRKAKNDSLLDSIENLLDSDSLNTADLLQEVAIQTRYSIKAETCLIFESPNDSRVWNIAALDSDCEDLNAIQNSKTYSLGENSIVNVCAIGNFPLRLRDFYQAGQIYTDELKGVTNSDFGLINYLKEVGVINLNADESLSWMGVPVKKRGGDSPRYFIVLINKNKPECVHFSPTDASIVGRLANSVASPLNANNKKDNQILQSGRDPDEDAYLKPAYDRLCRNSGIMLTISFMAFLCMLALIVFVEQSWFQRLLTTTASLGVMWKYFQYSRDFEAQAIDILDKLTSRADQVERLPVSPFRRIVKGASSLPWGVFRNKSK